MVLKSYNPEDTEFVDAKLRKGREVKNSGRIKNSRILPPKSLSQYPPMPPQNPVNVSNVKDSEIKTTVTAQSVVKPDTSVNKLMSAELPILDNDIDLNKLFSSEVGNDNDVLKELFTYDNIKTKTDLSKNDISIISRLELQAHLLKSPILMKVIHELELLRVSKDRLGRGEFVGAFGTFDSTNRQASIFQKIGGMFNKDKV